MQPYPDKSTLFADGGTVSIGPLTALFQRDPCATASLASPDFIGLSFLHIDSLPGIRTNCPAMEISYMTKLLTGEPAYYTCIRLPNWESDRHLPTLAGGLS